LKGNNEDKEISFDDSFSPPPEELNIRMPEMSALVVNEGSHINDMSKFNLDDIFGSNNKSATVHTEHISNNILSQNESNLKINQNSKNKILHDPTEVPQDSISLSTPTKYTF
jgi:hypothetical protein